MAGLEHIRSTTATMSDDSDDEELFNINPSEAITGKRVLATDHDDDLQLYQPKQGWRRYEPSLKILMPYRPTTQNIKDKNARNIDQTGFVSFVTFWWIFPYLWKTFRGTISQSAKWSCSIYDSASVNMARLEHFWKLELKTPSSSKKGPRLWCAVLKFMKTRLLIACFVCLFCIAFGFIGPTCLVRVLISYVETRNQHLIYGIQLVLALFLIELFRVFSYGATWATSYRTAIRVRGALLALLFSKLIRARSLGKNTIGEVLNIYANDGQRIFDAVVFAPLVIVGPFVLIGGMIYLLVLIGPWSLAGLAVFLLFDILQFALGKTMVKYRKLAINSTKQRVSLMTEVLHCVKLIKIYAWEQPFMNLIQNYRKSEMSALRTAGLAQSLAIAAGPAVPIVATIITFLGFIGTKNDLLASEAFSIITVYFVMVFGIRMIPYGIRYCAEALLSLKNIQTYLMLEDAYVIRCTPVSKNLSLVFQDASFSWQQQQQQPVDKSNNTAVASSEKSSLALNAINLVVEKKEIIAICGPVGSGKSSLLGSLIGQTMQTKGTLMVNGEIAYAAQEPWIFPGTIRENILFGETFDDQRYYKVLYACALNSDVNALPVGDETEISDRGTTLSGGQKARINLARALYSFNKDIYLLDSPLSSLDRNVAEHVFMYGVKSLLINKTVLLVTNQIEFLSKCHEVIFMSDGRTVDQGPHEELLARCVEYATFCSSTELVEQLESRVNEDVNVLDLLSAVETPTSPEAEKDFSLKKSASQSGLKIETDISGKLGEEEEDYGLSAIPMSVYRTFARSAGGCFSIVLLFLSFLISTAVSILCTVWLSYWLKQGHQQHPVHFNNITIGATTTTTTTNLRDIDTRFGAITASLVTDRYMHFYMTTYGLLLCLVVLTSFVKSFLFVKISLTAATNLHNRLLNAIMHSCMRFFDSTPSGRIINRFSKDLDEVDVKLPFTLESFLQNLMMVAGYLIVIAIVFPWFLVAIVPIGLLFALFVACFRAGIRSLKRAENISRSPMFAHISTSLQGVTTIHAFNQVNIFMDRLKSYLDENSSWLLLWQSALRWLAVWLDVLVVMVTTVTALLIVLSVGYIDAAYAGMSLAFAIQMSGIFQFAVRLQSELESKMTSVERINYYVNQSEKELPWEDSSSNISFDWPTQGRISYRDVRMRYRGNMGLVLKDVSFDVQPKEHVGIVGRTGSGKSSLAVALFRLYELSGGSISIDGIDISTVGLHDLRKRMTIIPQDPVLFANTIRFNLDPVNQYTDDQIWQALENTRIKQLISGFNHGLETELTEGGKNLSVGERQLLCMARALLKNVKILVLDEATSSVDDQTNRLIHQCLRETFSQCTVLIIAHRIDSISSCDKIMFMDDGKLMEFDPPNVLLDDPRSKFYQLAKNIKQENWRKSVNI